ncbi:MAG: DNA polymerase I [Aaplasma endosymbiont of Hyalomma asiaticum]
MVKKSFVVIDAYGFLFRAYYALPNLSTSQGFPVGGIYGFINIFLRHLLFHSADYVVVAFDSGTKNFRHALYPQYKSNRPKAPEDLVQQCELLREAVAAFNVESEDISHYEADDVIATISARYASDEVALRILSADKDLLQLLSKNVQIYDPIKSKYITNDYVIDKFGVTPDKLLDAMALTGDASDNIPGVPSIGVKTAAKLINEFGSLDGVLSNVEKLTQKKCREMLIQYSDQARLSRELISLCTSVELEGTIEKYRRKAPDVGRLMKFLEEYELTSLESKVAKYCKTFSGLTQDEEKDRRVKAHNEYSIDRLEDFFVRCNYSGKLALYVSEEKEVIKEVFASFDDESHLIVRGEGNIAKFVKYAAPILMSASVLKIVYDLKSVMRFFPELSTVDDIMIMSYSLDASSHNHEFESISQRYLGQVSEVSPACILIMLHKCIRSKLFSAKLFTVYYTIERPLVRVMYEMQKAGIMVDIDILQRLSEEFSSSITVLEEEIYKIAGCEFNVASSKQLGEVLFEQLHLGKAKKMNSGSYCTNAEVLKQLHIEGVEIADKILRWRHFTKLKSTYTDAIAKRVDPETRRVYTSYSMISTATGRISSSNPNLQNIPIRSKEGEEIRRAFIAREGYKLIAADYSQMELKILAHIADVRSFRDAFAKGLDIHEVTARQIFGEHYKVDSELRRRAKSINFGIIYGMGSFGVARNIGMSRKEASGYVEQYFKHYPEIKKYMEKTKAYARKFGYTNTVFGRKCFINGINSKVRAVRSVAERAAINAPIQGTAADIIKKAMVKLHDRLKNGTIVLQIHDELLVEVEEKYVNSAAGLMKEVMEGVVEFSVPLEVNISIGNNWGDMDPVVP